MSAPAQSPCNKNCVLAPDRRTCIGCARTVEEITAWSRADEGFRRAVLARIAALGDRGTEPPEGSEPANEKQS